MSIPTSPKMDQVSFRVVQLWPQLFAAPFSFFRWTADERCEILPGRYWDPSQLASSRGSPDPSSWEFWSMNRSSSWGWPWDARLIIGPRKSVRWRKCCKAPSLNRWGEIFQQALWSRSFSAMPDLPVEILIRHWLVLHSCSFVFIHVRSFERYSMVHRKRTQHLTQHFPWQIRLVLLWWDPWHTISHRIHVWYVCYIW